MITFKLIAIFGVIIYGIYRKLKKIYSFWESKGVKGPKPLWFAGNVLPVLRKKESMNTLTQQIYDMYPKEKVVGVYLGVTPTLILKDLTLIRKLLIKDFASFADRGVNVTKEKLSDNMFMEKGDKWRVYRQKMYPLFSTGRMKNIMPNVEKHVEEYLDYIDNLPSGPKELRMLDHKLSVNLMMSSVFGLKVDSFNEDVAELESMGYNLLQINIREIIANMLHGYNPDLPAALGLKLASPKLEKFVEILINKSKKATEDNTTKEENLFDFMVKLKEQGAVIKEKRDGVTQVKISDSVLSGHAAIFYVAGFEFFVVSSFLLFELALNQHIQERCYKEIDQVMKKYNGDFTLEAIVELHYVNMVFDETLRKYPSGGFLSRIALKDYHFEDINLTIEKGTKVIVPVQAIHHDPEYYPNPETFDPERFSPENRKMISDCSYLPFGHGPRKCIGYRLGRFHSVLLVAQFLHRFRVTPCEKTVSTIRIVPDRFSLFAQDGLWVNILKR